MYCHENGFLEINRMKLMHDKVNTPGDKAKI